MTDTTKNQLIAFAEQISRNGTGITIKLSNGGIESVLVPTYTKIVDLTNGVTLFTYLSNIIRNSNPDEIMVSVKKSNGSGFKSPAKTFMFTNDKMQQSLNGHPYQPMQQQAPQATMSPSAQVLKLQIEILEKELAKAEKKTADYDAIRNENFRLTNELLLAETKSSLAAQKVELEQKNTLGSITDKLLPIIQPMIEQKMGVTSGDSAGQLAGVAANNTKLGLLYAALNQFDDHTFNVFFEMILRMINLSTTTIEDFEKLYNTIKKHSASYDAEFESYSQLKNK